MKSYPRLNDHGSGCKGHANAMLDCTYEKREDRDLLIRCINNYIPRENMDLPNGGHGIQPPNTGQGPNLQKVPTPTVD